MLKINDVLEYNPPYVQSDFTCNLGPTKLLTSDYEKSTCEKFLSKTDCNENFHFAIVC